uniref:MBL fold metallo-hydrolase n=1 Tax=Bursaphelenchus xylophilus TaxID=6326 RepID=A0A1I7SKE9_BURXY
MEGVAMRPTKMIVGSGAVRSQGVWQILQIHRQIIAVDVGVGAREHNVGGLDLTPVHFAVNSSFDDAGK